MPDELWTEVCDIVLETGIPMEKKCKKAKWLSGEALQIAVNRREEKSKGEKERYKHLNAEFQRIARRDKKAFLRDPCKEIEENNRMGKTRDLFKKIADTKGTFHAKRGSIKEGSNSHPLHCKADSLHCPTREISGHMFSLVLCICLGMEFLGHMVTFLAAVVQGNCII